MFVNYFDPHAPWLRRNNEFTPPFSEHFERYQAPLLEVTRDEIPLDCNIRDYLIQLYKNEIFYLDNHLSEMVGLLRDRGLYENSIIVILSDHGEMFGEHNLMDHIMLYEPVIRIPMMVKLPNSQFGGKRIPLVVQNIDVFPTVLSILGIPLAGEVQGEDLMRLIQDDIPLQRSFAISEFYPDPKTAQTYGPRFDGEFIAYIEGPRKYIYNSPRSDELYDRCDDPFEQENLIDSATIPSSLRVELLTKLRSNVNWELVTGEVEIDEVVLRRLQDLGYI